MAIPITKQENNKIRLKIDDVKKILDDIGDTPVAIVSVNGPMRSGKSYILGHFLRYLSTMGGEGDWINKKLNQEFYWKNSSDRQTTGINIWSRPFYVMKDGRKIAVLLLDTQGSFDDKTTATENTFYFAISCLLSSVLIYNVPKQISEDMLQFLQLFIGYAKLNMEGADAKPFSKLVFLVRDWQFPNDYEYGFHDDQSCPSEKNYKKEKLDANRTMVAQVKVVHEEIVGSFENVGCCLMPHPGMGLAVRDKIDDLEPEFVDIIQDLIPRIFKAENLVIKTIGGQEITGNVMKKLIKVWDELFAKEDIPEVKTMAEAAADAQGKTNVSIAFKIYKNEMKDIKESNGLPEKELKIKHEEAKTKAIRAINEMKQFGGDGVKERYEKELKKMIKEKLESYNEINTVILRFTKSFEQNKSESEKERKILDKRIQELERIREQEQMQGKTDNSQIMEIFTPLGRVIDRQLSVPVDVIAMAARSLGLILKYMAIK